MFIEDLTSNSEDLPEPVHDVRISDDFVRYEIKLESIDKLPDYELVLTDSGIDFEVPGLYRLSHSHYHNIDEENVKAKFVRKTRSLKIDLPIVK